MNQPLVSVVIPTYNRAHCLPKTIDSVLAQTYSNVEAVVIDDGSRDHTAELMAERYGSKPRVRYVRQPNGGVSSARNHGLRISRGELVALLDSDDIWLPWKLNLQVAALKRFPDAVMSWTDMTAIKVNGEVVAERYLRKMYSAYRWFRNEDLYSESLPLAQLCPERASDCGSAKVFQGKIYSQMLMGNLVHTSTVVMRRAILDQVGPFDETMRKAGEDYDFHIRTCRQGPVLYLDLPTIYYLTGLEDQITAPGSGVYFAKAYLHTMSREWKEHRAQIQLPRTMIRAAQAEAHGWVGEELLELGQRQEARSHLWQSIRLEPWRARKYALLLKSLLPSGMTNALRRVYQVVKPKAKAKVQAGG